MRKNRFIASFRTIANCLFIIIVIGLVVFLLTDPNSFTTKIEEVFSDLGSKTQSSSEIFLEVKEYDDEALNQQFGYKCSLLEQESAFLGKGGSFRKANECTNWCGKKGLEYHHFKCIADRLHCYCEY